MGVEQTAAAPIRVERVFFAVISNTEPLIRPLAAAVAVILAPALLAAQAPPPDSVRQQGVARASAVVDSVFVDRQLAEGLVASGDWASYLMARLGIYPIPADLRIEVLCDTQRITIQTKVGDLPAEAKLALGPIVGMLPPETVVAGDIGLQKVAREVVQFRLETVRVNGVPLPEGLVATVMMDVGKKYPALSRSGRSLFVEIPTDAAVELRRGAVRLVGPPADTAGGIR
jgi:hypothetical protein